MRKDKKVQWSNEALDLVIKAIDNGYKYSVVCIEFGIPRSNLRDYKRKKIKTKKWDQRRF